MRAELLVDPETHRIAKALQLEVPDYVERVLKYAQNPELEPVLTVLSDAELRSRGYEPPSMEEVRDLFIQAIEADERSSFGGPPPAALPSAPAATAPKGPVDPKLKEALAQQRKKSSGDVKG